MAPRIGVIGGGLAGCLTALKLAQRGIPSEIFERNDGEFAEASYFNEGKVHLGFLYAHDLSKNTSDLMIQGAVRFRHIVSDLAGCDVADALSTPFLYAVHRDSLVPPDDFAEHLGHCCRRFSESLGDDPSAAGYVNASKTVGYRKLPTSEWSGDLDPEFFSAVFQTDEYGVDPRWLARQISRAVRDNTKIALHTGTRVHAVAPVGDDRWSLTDIHGEILGDGEFDVVLNASWSDLLRIDQTVGVELPQEWSYRYKLGNRVLRSVTADDLSSVTVVLGAFGDIVNYGNEGGIFVSWYPSGRLLMTDEVDLPDWNGEHYRERREAAFRESMSTWESMSTKLRALDIGTSKVDTRGGMILATGRLDVDDPNSPLHSRVQVGLTQRGSYLSLNTGKYTLAPLMALRAADAIHAAVVRRGHFGGG